MISGCNRWLLEGKVAHYRRVSREYDVSSRHGLNWNITRAAGELTWSTTEFWSIGARTLRREHPPGGWTRCRPDAAQPMAGFLQCV
jgi:hypothetical protein